MNISEVGWLLLGLGAIGFITAFLLYTVLWQAGHDSRQDEQRDDNGSEE